MVPFKEAGNLENIHDDYAFLDMLSEVVIYGGPSFVGSLVNEGFEPMLVNTEFYFNRKRSTTCIRFCRHCVLRKDEEAPIAYGGQYWEFDELIPREVVLQGYPELPKAEGGSARKYVFALSMGSRSTCTVIRTKWPASFDE